MTVASSLIQLFELYVLCCIVVVCVVLLYYYVVLLFVFNALLLLWAASFNDKFPFLAARHSVA